ncbi:MAG: rod shape-determining protein MreC, partial [Acidobacteriota bacterium]
MISRHASAVALLVGLLFGFFVLMSYQVNRTATVSAMEGTVQTVLRPAQRMVAAVWLGISSSWHHYVGLVGATRQADSMSEQIGTLQRRAVFLEEAARENSRLRQLLALRQRLQRPSLAAEVIGRDITDGYGTLTVNRGSWDGAQVDSPALAPGGALLGRVVDVFSLTSMVQLITDEESAAGVKVVRSGARGVVHGTGGGVLQLAYVRSLADVEEGDLVVTSGDDGLFPPGIPVGRVSRVAQGSPVPDSPPVPLAREETALFKEITLTPMVEVRRI